MSEKIDGEISTDLMKAILKTLSKLTAIHSTSHSILINIMGGQTRSFFRELRKNKDVEVLWTGWLGKYWWTYIFSFIPGQAGLVKILNRTRLDILVEEVGEMSYCGIYFIPNEKIDSVTKLVKLKNNGISEFFENENNYFLLDVDFDYRGGERDEEILYRQIIMSDTLDAEIRQTLMQTE